MNRVDVVYLVVDLVDVDLDVDFFDVDLDVVPFCGCCPAGGLDLFPTYCSPPQGPQKIDFNHILG